MFCCFIADVGMENIGDVTVTNPEITCSTYPDDSTEQEDGHRTPTQDEDIDDIDQAFANYERDHPNAGTKTLQEQLNIISMVSEKVLLLHPLIQPPRCTWLEFPVPFGGWINRVPLYNVILFVNRTDYNTSSLHGRCLSNRELGSYYNYGNENVP